MKTTHTLLISLTFATVLLGAVASLLCYRSGLRKGLEKVVTRVDTVTVVRVDTVTKIKPVPVYSRVVDSILVPVPVSVHDTVQFALPREEKVYEDSTYRAVVSGFRPSLDSISVYRKETVVTITNTVQAPVKHWGFGLAAGPGLLVDLQGRAHGGFAVVGGVVYRF